MNALAAQAVWLIVFGQAPGGAAEDRVVRYDPAKVVDITGIVEEIHQVESPPAVRGIHFLVRAENEGRIDVYVGPAWFVKEFIANFDRRSEVQVIGSKVKRGSSVVVLAREVRKGGITLYLRDKDGNPYWGEVTLMRRGQSQDS